MLCTSVTLHTWGGAGGRYSYGGDGGLPLLGLGGDGTGGGDEVGGGDGDGKGLDGGEPPE